MSPKIDFAFKLLFGDERNKNLLISFLSAILNVPKEELRDVKVINSELFRDYKEDKKGILDVRVETKDKKQIDIEIQINPIDYMDKRTIYYWSKMYAGQLKSGEVFDKLKKCITVNIVDFKCTDIKKLHTVYHITEDEVHSRLTEMLEIHFLELGKLFDEGVRINEDDPVVQWMKFLDAKTREVMEMLGEKNKDIEEALRILEVMSKDEKARMEYEAREAALKDERTRIKSAEEKGIEKGIVIGEEKGRKEERVIVAKKLIRLGLDIKDIMETTGLTEAEIKELS